MNSASLLRLPPEAEKKIARSVGAANIKTYFQPTVLLAQYKSLTNKAASQAPATVVVCGSKAITCTRKPNLLQTSK